MRIRNKTGMKAVTITCITLFIYYLTLMPSANQKIDQATEFVMEPGYQTVEAYCIGCHTAKMITRRRASREQWLATVRRMQEIDGNWVLPTGIENTIVDYLAKYYGR